MTRWTRRLAFMALLALAARPAGAGEIQGALTDAAGGPLAGARITLENVATGAQTVAATDAGGRYSFGSVRIGIYRLAASVGGFSQQARTVSLASDSETLEVSFALSVGNLTTTVTVTATRGAQDTLLVPLRAESLGALPLQHRNPTSTGEAMILVPGITPVADGPFQMRPRLRGLDSTRVLVLVDGERLNNARTATDRAGVEVGLVDASTIESIEVVSGAGSVLYGTDALSGTLNVITRQPRLAEATRFVGGLNGYFSTNENGARGSATLGVASKRFAFHVSGGLDSFDNYQAGGKDGETLEDTRPLFGGPCPVAGFTRNPCLRNPDTIDDNFPPFDFGAFPDPFNAPYARTSAEIPRSGFQGDHLNTNAFVALTDKQSLQVKYLRRTADDVGFPDFQPPQFFQGIVLPFSNLEKVSGRYQARNLSPKYGALTATFYWQEQDRKLQNLDIPVTQFPVPSAAFFPINVFRVVVNSSTEQDVKTWGFDLQNTFLLSPRNVLTAGLTLYRDRSHDTRESRSQLFQVGFVGLGSRGPAATVFPSPVAAGPAAVTFPVRVPDATFRDLGLFAQDEWDVTPRLRVVAGLRFDSYDVTAEATPGYSISVAGAAPAIDPATLPDVNGDSVSRTAVTGSLGLVWKATDHLSVFAHYGRSYRHPNLEELLFFGPATIGNIAPNITVEPEKGNNVDLGLKVRSGRIAGSLTYFHNRYDGFISQEIVALLPASNSSISQAVNFADVRIQGLEADADVPVSLGGALATFFGRAAWNRGTILSGSNPLTRSDLAGTPQDNITPFKFLAGLRLSDKKDRFWAEYSCRHQSQIERVPQTLLESPFLIAQDIYGLNGFTLHRVGAGIDWRRASYRVGLSIALENFGDKYYREQFQFAPARGRSFTVGLHLNKS